MNGNLEKHMNNLVFRQNVLHEDCRRVRELVHATGFFRPDEVLVAEELVVDRLQKGDKSEYHFWFAEIDNVLAGYACYGPIACSIGSYDLFWIVVDPIRQKMGAGRALLHKVEQTVSDENGRLIYAETSGTDLYIPTRDFYRRCGYIEETRLKDFYAPGDDKVFFVKKVDTK